jgi:hypothetical protein
MKAIMVSNYISPRFGERQCLSFRQQKQIDAVTTGLQKVGAQLELSEPVPQTVLNDR